MIDLEQFPRVDLCHQPTPLEPMTRTSEHLGGAEIMIKRDDCTGLATGGNKTRKLEFLIGDALAQDADVVVTQGAVQSNHVRQTAAAACRHDLASHGLLERRVSDAAPSYEQTGNVFLDQIFGATLEFRPAGLDMNNEAQVAAEKLRAQGRKPYFIPGGGSNEIGALGYVACALELEAQSQAGNPIDWLVLATGSTGTQAGLVAGLHAIGSDIRVMGISVRQKTDVQIKAVHALAEKVARKIDAASVPVSKVMVDDGYIGEGYGVPAQSTLDAIMLAARMDGILLDPVYSAKGFAGLVGLVRSGFFSANDTVAFLHTGGSAALFAYESMIGETIMRDDERRTSA